MLDKGFPSSINEPYRFLLLVLLPSTAVFKTCQAIPRASFREQSRRELKLIRDVYLENFVTDGNAQTRQNIIVMDIFGRPIAQMSPMRSQNKTNKQTNKQQQQSALDVKGCVITLYEPCDTNTLRHSTTNRRTVSVKSSKTSRGVIR